MSVCSWGSLNRGVRREGKVAATVLLPITRMLRRLWFATASDLARKLERTCISHQRRHKRRKQQKQGSTPLHLVKPKRSSNDNASRYCTASIRQCFCCLRIVVGISLITLYLLRVNKPKRDHSRPTSEPKLFANLSSSYITFSRCPRVYCNIILTSLGVKRRSKLRCLL